jgi:hypothetical protein
LIDTERSRDYGQIALKERLRQVIRRLNPKSPANLLEEVFRKLSRPDVPSFVGGYHAPHLLSIEVAMALSAATSCRSSTYKPGSPMIRNGRPY